MYLPAGLSECYAESCGTPALTLMPSGMGSSSTGQDWINATTIVIDGTQLLPQVNLHFRHQSITDIEEYYVEANTYECNSATHDCSVMCPQIVVDPSTISRHFCESDNSDCEFASNSIAATTTYDASTSTWTATLERECDGTLNSVSATTVSAFLLACVGGVALLPLLPLRALMGGAQRTAGSAMRSWGRVVGSASFILVAVLVLSTNLGFDFGSSGAAANVVATDGCECVGDEDVFDVGITFYHSPNVLINGTAEAGMSDTYGTAFSGGILTLQCTNGTCWSDADIGLREGSGLQCFPNSEWDDGCVIGRPLIVDGKSPIRAPVEWTQMEIGSDAAGNSWAPYITEFMDGLSAAEQHSNLVFNTSEIPANALSASRWVAQGIDEHASVASFNRFALNLMAFGAPPHLIRRSQQAALDETKHAELSYSLAALLNTTASGAASTTPDSAVNSVWAPVPLGMPIPNPMALDDTTDNLLRSAFREGCIGELTAAVSAAAELHILEASLAKQCPSSTSSVDCFVANSVTIALEAIADEESGHAVLAWKALEWLLSLDSTETESDQHKQAFSQEMAVYVQELAAGSPGSVEIAVANRLVAKFVDMISSGVEFELPTSIVQQMESLEQRVLAQDVAATAVVRAVDVVLQSVRRRW